MQKLSFIIPVYNTEKQIERCLQSIVNQTDKNFEAIIVNDGSTDNSERVILDYRDKYPDLFIYYKKENTGIADTRNFGIDKATGKYLLFIDSDDYIDCNLVQNLRKYMEKDIDVIKFKLNIVKEEIYRIDGPTFLEVDGETAFNLLAFDDIMFDSPCVYIFKRGIFVEKKFEFRVGTYHEDFGLIPLVILSAKSVISTNINGYYYVQTDNSITRNDDYKKTIKRFEDSLLHYDNMLQFIRQLSISNKTKENVKQYYTNAILLKLKSLKTQDRKKYIKQIKQRKMIRNIKVKNLKQLLKRIILSININWYLKLRK